MNSRTLYEDMVKNNPNLTNSEYISKWVDTFLCTANVSSPFIELSQHDENLEVNINRCEYLLEVYNDMIDSHWNIYYNSLIGTAKNVIEKQNG